MEIKPIFKFDPNQLNVPFGQTFKVKFQIKPKVLGSFSVNTVIADSVPYVFMVNGDPFKEISFQFQLREGETHHQWCEREVDVLIKSYKNSPNNIILVRGFRKKCGWLRISN